MASFENIPVTLKGFEMEDASMLWSVFVAQIGRNVKVGCRPEEPSACGCCRTELQAAGIVMEPHSIFWPMFSFVVTSACDRY